MAAAAVAAAGVAGVLQGQVNDQRLGPGDGNLTMEGMVGFLDIHACELTYDIC
jgi:hypothetical protein